MGTGDMPTEDVRAWGHHTVDWVADYLRRVHEFPVLSEVRPGFLKNALPPSAPEDGEDFDAIFRDFENVVLPGITHWNHPRFHGYFPVTGSGPGILGELLTAALNVNGMVWRASPAATELEELTVGWVRDLVGLPASFAGVIQDTASLGTFTALCAARHRAYPAVREQGLFGLPRGRVYASEEAHSSVHKAVRALGLGDSGLVQVPTDREYRMDVDALRATIRADAAEGIVPIAVVATLGTTSTTSVDPVDRVASVAREHGAWLHVDAAHAGSAASVPELRPLFTGWEEADSVVMNPHKWLFTPVDCSVLLTRDRATMKASLSLTPEYLTTPEAGATTNLMDYGLALGRRFRALKLWFVMRYFGAEGIRRRIRHHVAMGRAFAERLDGAHGWERAAPARFSTVVFRFAPTGMAAAELDALNFAAMERVNATGEAFLSHTRLRNATWIRLSIGNLRTTPEHLDHTWTLLQDAVAGVPVGP